MKRSEINKFIAEAEQFFARHHLYLPEFSHWTPEDWKKNRAVSDEILFTLRNGIAGSEKYTKPYAEKIKQVEPAYEMPKKAGCISFSNQR